MSALRDRLVALLSSTVGEGAARSTVDAALEDLDRDPDGLDQRAALDVLEHIAQRPGLIGVTARFAKSRLLLG
ncbi:MAG: hypothetical protein VYE22_39375 [Myxococcota bacterium]|nr:hypothetical protein [Myxococcota bacterium]